MKPIRTVPIFKDYLWGGNRLRSKYGKKSDLPVLAESWELSCNPNGLSGIEGWEGTLADFLRTQDAAFLGTDYDFEKNFPLLIKFIDAKKDLSLQVHPDNQYAAEHEHSFGKTEMWVVIEAAADAALYFGLNHDCTEKEVSSAIASGTLTEYLNRVPVSAGDVFFIPPGTIHAIGQGILLAEIQQNSDITYRLYDYNRRDAQGNLRHLDVEKGLEVANLAGCREKGVPRSPEAVSLLAHCPYFSTYRYTWKGNVTARVDPSHFEVLLVLEGSAALITGEEVMEMNAGDCFLLPACLGTFQMVGQCDCLRILPCDSTVKVAEGIVRETA